MAQKCWLLGNNNSCRRNRLEHHFSIVLAAAAMGHCSTVVVIHLLVAVHVVTGFSTAATAALRTLATTRALRSCCLARPGDPKHFTKTGERCHVRPSNPSDEASCAGLISLTAQINRNEAPVEFSRLLRRDTLGSAVLVAASWASATYSVCAEDNAGQGVLAANKLYNLPTSYGCKVSAFTNT